MRFCTTTSFDLQPELKTDIEFKIVQIVANVENILGPSKLLLYVQSEGNQAGTLTPKLRAEVEMCQTNY